MRAPGIGRYAPEQHASPMAPNLTPLRLFGGAAPIGGYTPPYPVVVGGGFVCRLPMATSPPALGAIRGIVGEFREDGGPVAVGADLRRR